MIESSPIKPVALVIGLCKHGLYLTRNFAAHNIPVSVIESNFSQQSAQTRFGTKILCSSLYNEILIETLIKIKKTLAPPVALFPTNDRMVDLLLHHYDELKDHYRLPFPPGDIVLHLKDKSRLHELASNAGLNVPQSFVVHSVDQLRERKSDLQFPVAVKPVLPMMSFKSRKCGNYLALESQVSASEKLGESLIVQRWIRGDDRAILFGAYYIAPNGTCSARFSGHKLMSYPPLVGHATAAEGYDIGDLLEEGADFFRKVGYWGLGSIEYKGMGIDKPQFIEVTVGRCDWWIMCCGINGVNIPIAAYNDLTGQDIPFTNNQVSKYVWRDFECEFPVLIDIIRNRRWSIRELMEYILKPKRDALFDIGDPKPFIAFLKVFLIKLLNALKRHFMNSNRNCNTGDAAP